MLRSSREAKATLASSREEFDLGALDNFKLWEMETRRGKNAIVWEDEDSLPKGWKVSVGLEEGKEILMDEKGTRFEGRKEAIDQLIKEQRSPGDIFKLWSTLHRDGWKADEERLPTGWKKKYFASEASFHYLSPMMKVGRTKTWCATKKLLLQVVVGTAALVQVVMRGKEYTKEEKTRVAAWRMNEEGL